MDLLNVKLDVSKEKQMSLEEQYHLEVNHGREILNNLLEEFRNFEVRRAESYLSMDNSPRINEEIYQQDHQHYLEKIAQPLEQITKAITTLKSYQTKHAIDLKYRVTLDELAENINTFKEETEHLITMCRLVREVVPIDYLRLRSFSQMRPEELQHEKGANLNLDFTEKDYQHFQELAAKYLSASMDKVNGIKQQVLWWNMGLQDTLQKKLEKHDTLSLNDWLKQIRSNGSNGNSSEKTASDDLKSIKYKPRETEGHERLM